MGFLTLTLWVIVSSIIMMDSGLDPVNQVGIEINQSAGEVSKIGMGYGCEMGTTNWRVRKNFWFSPSECIYSDEFLMGPTREIITNLGLKLQIRSKGKGFDVDLIPLWRIGFEKNGWIVLLEKEIRRPFESNLRTSVMFKIK